MVSQSRLIDQVVNVEDLIKDLGGFTLEDSADALSNVQPLDGDLSVPALPAPFLSVSFLQQKCHQDYISFYEQKDWSPKFPLAATPIFGCEVVKGRQLSKEAAHKTALEITIDLKDAKVNCDAGDAISLICANVDSEVEGLVQRLGLDQVADQQCLFTVDTTAKKTAKVPPFFPPQASLRSLFKFSLDIRSVPKKPLLRVLAEFTTDPHEKKILNFLCSKQGADEYLKRVRAANLCVLDILLALPTCHPPVERLLEHLPQLAARPYSCASYSADGQLVDILFHLVSIPAEQGRMFPRSGLCTSWLRDRLLKLDQNQPSKLYLFGRPTQSFRMPDHLDTPLIMIGPGTGVAPFRGFLQKRDYLRSQGTSALGETWLFFGCRHKDLDYLYEDEMAAFRQSGILSRLSVAFSRDQEAADVKYVQDAIRIEAEHFVRMVFEARAVVFVCGDAKNMAKEVQQAIIQNTASVLGISQVEAQRKVADLVVEGRYLQDVWT